MIRTSHYTHTTKRHVKETFVNSDRLPLTCNCPDAKSVMQTAKCVFYRLSASGPINILNLPKDRMTFELLEISVTRFFSV